MLTIKSEGIREIADSLSMAVRDAGDHVQDTMEHMGPIIARMMQRQLASHRYTGSLEESITWRYVRSRRELRVGSDLQRGGKYNALEILQRGTGPIANLPFTPIAQWAAFKGLPAGPVWMSIKQSGVSPHPAMGDLQARPEFHRTMQAGAKKLASDLLVKALKFRRGMTV
ncbi:MAG: hypothetical protein ACXABY_01035 [Candidatus Thorarchaeota archaeon]|jgi:hypothetical protein